MRPWLGPGRMSGFADGERERSTPSRSARIAEAHAVVNEPNSVGRGQSAEAAPVLGANPFVPLSRAQVAAALGRLGQRLVVEPGLTVSSAMRATGGLLEVAVGRSDVRPDPKDKRFAFNAFQSHPLYRRMAQSYVLMESTTQHLVDNVELDEKSRARAKFATSLVTEALAPTNTLIGNPAAFARARETKGRSLLHGARNFLYDLRTNGGMPSMVDTRPFRIGETLALTPGQVVHRSEVLELIQYEPTTDKVHTRPLVVIPPQINKYYITDLAPGRSLVAHMVGAGVPYFAISWRNPTARQRGWNLDTYVAAALEAVEAAAQIAGSEDANVAGICAGGVTMAALLGHLAATSRPLVNSATFMVSALDTSVPSLAATLASGPAIQAARRRSSRAGVLDGRDLARLFAWLRANDLVWNYWVNNYLMGMDPPAFDILYWNADTTRLPAGLHADFLDLFVSNSLVQPGELSVMGTPVDLSKVDCDAYVIGAAADHIVPWPATFRTAELLGGRCQFTLSSSGHIQAILNPPGGRSSFRTGTVEPDGGLEGWSSAAEHFEGSWWDHWATWLDAHSGGHTAAPVTLGSDRFEPLCPAPGTYALA
jgi:polyhydroxyalkanoate synthase subunit PhaC